MQTKHARVSVESGQLFVEPIGGGTVFFSLIGPYRLQPGDMVKMGSQILEFRANSSALEMAASTGASIKEVSAKLPAPVAELVSTTDQKAFPLPDVETTFGRTKGTYTFSDNAMSRSHAKVYHRGEDFFLEDTGSTNGTFVRAREKTPVPDGAIVSVAGQLLRVVRETK
jgi:pSer/pThr/pTyr-binding forkhead associated (FHA) protein